MKIKWIIIIILIIVAVMGWQLVFGRPSFDADKIAQSETHMWQAYYTGNKTKIGLELISLLRNQYGLSLLEAKDIGELLASSAMKFRSSKGNYENIVLGDLTEAYRLIKLASGRSFEPENTARAELAWWVARRTPGQGSVEQIGQKITELYELLYETNNSAFVTAGFLRAKAAELRDSGKQNADWDSVNNLLRQSYHELKKGI